MPTLVVIAAVAIFSVALLTNSISGSRSVNHHKDDYQLSAAVESVATLAAEMLWSGYVTWNGGAPGSIGNFQFYLDSLEIENAGPGGPPTLEEGKDVLGLINIPGYDVENPEFDNVNVEEVKVVRRDQGDSTQIYLTVLASTNRGKGLVNPVLHRAVQQIYTVEPEDFEGFEYGLLANNVNCIFCHTQVDSVDRFYNYDSAEHNSYDRVKVGTLQSLMIRKDMYNGDSTIVDHGDADSYVAGTIYVRGTATDHDGNPIGSTDWSDLTLGGFEFDSSTGKIVEDAWGGLSPVALAPAGDPAGPMENLYLDYPLDYASMPDGKLPPEFPPPFPDDGGYDPDIGGPDPSAAGNKQVDKVEFDAVAGTAEGEITAGVITVVPEGFKIDNIIAYNFALNTGNSASIQQTVEQNVILTGTHDNPITIDGTVAIDGDLIINGFITGEGSLLVSGNVYIPTDLHYKDGKEYLPGDSDGSPTGPKTFGVAPDGTPNALGLAAGGNILIGDYQSPTYVTKDGGYQPVGLLETIAGGNTGKWSFALAEISLFNKDEWAKTQPTLPGPPDEYGNPTTVANPYYAQYNYDDAGNFDPYVPRYYHYGEDDTVPIYNGGDLYFDPATLTWHGDEEVPFDWNDGVDYNLLTEADPTDSSDPTLFNPDGTPKAVLSQIAPKDNWISDDMYKLSVEIFELVRPWGKPMMIDGLLYTNNSIFSITHTTTSMQGQMLVNGALVAADLGMLVPGHHNPSGNGTSENTPGTDFAVGLQLNYDKRVKEVLNVKNPNQVQIKKTLWNPTANIQLQ